MNNKNVPNKRVKPLIDNKISNKDKIKSDVMVFLKNNKTYTDKNNFGIKVNKIKVPFFVSYKDIKKKTVEKIVEQSCVLLQEISVEKDSNFLEMISGHEAKIQKPIFNSMKNHELKSVVDFENFIADGFLIWAKPETDEAKIIGKELFNDLLVNKLTKDAFQCVEYLIEKGVQRMRKFKAQLNLIDEKPIQIYFKDGVNIILNPKEDHEKKLLFVIYTLYIGGWTSPEEPTENNSAEFIEKFREIAPYPPGKTLSAYLEVGKKKRSDWNQVKQKFIFKTYDSEKIFLNPLISID